MPLGIQRLNAQPSQHPTPHIGFIKPLPGPSEAAAHAFLSRIAAVSHPILAKHHLGVMSLEEFPANREFLGRNFNAGECIQLVLRARGGGWLPFRQVAMVMMHELAHCVQMNHRRAFWEVRDAYAGELRALWARGYRGEGLWGRGRALGEAGDEAAGVSDGLAELPDEVCGGAYRGRRGRKRKRKGGTSSSAAADRPSYAERQQRRIARKFGAGGVALGADDAARSVMLRGKKTGSLYTRPRVAQSNRGRELRAQAALARLAHGVPAAPAAPELAQTALPFKREESPAESERSVEDSDSEYDDPDSDADSATHVAADASGAPLKDHAGRELVKVCPSDDQDDVFIKSEWDELQDLRNIPLANAEPQSTTSTVNGKSRPTGASKASVLPATTRTSRGDKKMDSIGQAGKLKEPEPEVSQVACPACSLANPVLSVTCEVCGCVLCADKTPGSWKCESTTCTGGLYVNSRDSRRCGVCGASQE